MLGLIAVIADKLVQKCLAVVVIADVYKVDVDALDEVTAGLPPMDEMMVTEVGANDIDDNVSPLDAMRPAGSISRWTRMCDNQCFPLMQH